MRESRRRATAEGAKVTVILAIILPIAVFAHRIHQTLLAAACTITGCHPAGTAAAGWLVPTMPLWLAGLYLLLRERVTAPIRILIGLMTSAFGVVALSFVPGKGRMAFGAALLGRPGADTFATGLRWGTTGVLLAVISVALLGFADGGRYRRGQACPGPPRRRLVIGSLLVILLTVGALAVALARAM